MKNINVRIKIPIGEAICWDVQRASETETHVTITKDGICKRMTGQIIKSWDAKKAPFF